MSAFSILVLFVLAISMLAIGVSLTYAMVNNFNNGKRHRQNLDNNINNLRYAKVLTFFGINKSEFIHKVPLVEIENGIRACMSCKQIEQCDKTFEETGIFDDGALAFCPNSASIQNQKATY